MKKFNLNIKKLTATLFAIFLIVGVFLRLTLNQAPIFPNAKLTSDKKIFKGYEVPKFKLILNEKETSSLVKSVFAEGDPTITAEFINSNDKKTTIIASVSKEDFQTYSISPTKTNSFKPGKYTLSTTIETQTGVRHLTQDFNWGVLALNPNKATYNPNEVAEIAIGVLNDKGDMVCNADVILTITNPDGTKVEKKTSNGSIKTTNQCYSKEESIIPDYATSLQLSTEGTYTLNLLATTKNGTYQIQDFIKVSTNIPFDIERESATRLYPKNQYPMTINIIANQDYKGTVSETVPSDFAIIKSKQDNKTTDYAAKISEEKDFRLITWSVDWKKGEKHTLSYVYQAPVKSPDFFLLGNLRLENEFSEGRMWQLANDSVGTVRPNADFSNNFATCTTNGNGSCRFGVVDETTEITGDYVTTGTAGSGGEVEEYDMDTVAGSNTVSQVDVKFQANSVGGCASTCDTLSVNIFIAGAYVGAQTATMTASDQLFTVTFSGTWTGDTDLRIQFTRNVLGTGPAGNRDDDVRIYQAYADVTYTTGITVSGNAYSTGTTPSTECDANAGTNELTLRTNGASYNASCSNSDGSYSFTPVTGGSAGSQIVVWLDNLTTDGAVVARYDGTGDSATNTLYDSVITVTSDDSNAVTNAIMGTYDGDDDTDIPYTSNSNALVTNSGIAFLAYVKSGSSTVYSPGGTISTNSTGGNLTVNANATANIDTASSTIGGNLTVNGTLNISGSTTLTGTGSIAAGGALTFSADLTVNGGALTTTSTGTISTSSTPTLNMSGTGSLGGGSGNISLYALTTSGTGTTTFSGSGTNTISNNVTVGTGTTLNINSSVTITGTLTNTTTGIINTTSGTPTVTINGSSVGGGSGDITFYNLTVGVAGTVTFSGSGTNTINNTLAVNAGTTLSINNSVSIANSLTNATSGAISYSGTPTITMTGTGSIGGGTTGAITFYNLITSGTGTITFSNGGTNTIDNNISVGAATTLRLNSDISITGNLTNTTSGVITTTAGTPTVTVSGSSIGGGTTGAITFYNLTKTGAGTTTFSNGGTNTINNALSASAGTLTIASGLTVGSSSVSNSGGISVAGTLNYSGTPTITVVSSSAGAATVGGAGTITFYNLSFLPAVASGPTFTLGNAASQAITIDNDLTIGNGSNGVTVSANTNNPTIDINGSLSIAASGVFTAPPSATFTIAKNMTNNGTFNNNSGTVTVDTTNSSTFDGSGTPAIQFNNLNSTTNNKTLIFTAAKTFRIDGAFTVSGTGSNIQSTSGTQWLINLQGTSNITNTTVINSGCSGSLDVSLNATNTNGGNNDTCWVFTAGPTIINSGIKGNTRIQGNVRIQ